MVLFCRVSSSRTLNCGFSLTLTVRKVKHSRTFPLSFSSEPLIRDRIPDLSKQIEDVAVPLLKPQGGSKDVPMSLFGVL